MKNTIKKIVNNSNAGAKDFLLAYIDGKTSDPMLLSILANTIEASGHPLTAECLLYLFNK
jgi:hypothetical protein